MKSMTTFGQVWNEVTELSQHCSDRLISTPDIVFDNLKTVRIAGVAHLLRPKAQSLIANRLGIPLQYLQRCPAEVQAYNLNHWITREPNPELFFRFDGQDVRAIFTPRYRPMDNLEVLERLTSLGYKADTRVQCCLDTEFMSLSIPDGSKTFDLEGDRITPGISISNSEVGLSSLRIAAFYLRLVCTNGLIAKTQVAVAYRHISRKILDDFPSVFGEVSRQQLRNRDQFRLSMESKVDDPAATIQSLNRQFQLTEKERDAVEWGWHFEPGGTMFAIVNAYTRAAMFNGLPASSAYRLQSVGGQILSMVK
jgi:Domain of unknown function (DUF932)